MQAFEESLYTGYRPELELHESESVSYKDVADDLADRLYPEAILVGIEDGDAYSPTDERSFIAYSSLSVTGAIVAMHQASIARRVDANVLEGIKERLFSRLAYTFASQHDLPETAFTNLIEQTVGLAKNVVGAFREHIDSKPPLPLPHWFASKEALAYLHNASPLNPEEVMVFSEYLSLCIRASKQFLDELLTRDIQVVKDEK